MVRQFYAAECTANPLWLFQVKGRFGTWETISVFGSRERAEEYGQAKSHTYGKRNHGWQVWSVPCFDEGLAKAVGVWKNSDKAQDKGVEPLVHFDPSNHQPKTINFGDGE